MTVCRSMGFVRNVTVYILEGVEGRLPRLLCWRAVVWRWFLCTLWTQEGLLTHGGMKDSPMVKNVEKVRVDGLPCATRVIALGVLARRREKRFEAFCLCKKEGVPEDFARFRAHVEVLDDTRCASVPPSGPSNHCCVKGQAQEEEEEEDEFKAEAVNERDHATQV